MTFTCANQTKIKLTIEKQTEREKKPLIRNPKRNRTNSIAKPSTNQIMWEKVDIIEGRCDHTPVKVDENVLVERH